jgi:hypothetical protein
MVPQRLVMDVQPLGQLADHRLWIGLPGQAHRALAQLIGVLLGRGHADAPEIDGLVRVKGKNLGAGDIVRAKVTAADGYDLAARAIGAPR